MASASLPGKNIMSKPIMERLRAIALEEVPNGIQIIDNNGYIVYSNKAVQNIFGFSPEEFEGKHLSEMNADHEFAGRVIFPALIDTGHWMGEILVKHKNGTIFPVRLNASLITYDDGEPLGYISVFADLKELKYTEEKIRFQAMLLNQVRNAVMATDLNGKIIYWNRFAETLYQWKAPEVIGKNIVDLLVSRDQKERVRGVANKVLKSGYFEGKLKECKKDGTWLMVESTITLIRDINDKPIGLISVKSDITQKEQIDKQLARLERLNLVGEMAAGIGHEVRNPITTVRGFLQLFLETEVNQAKREHYNLMIQELDKANSIISEYLTLAKDKRLQIELYNINTLIEKIEPLLKANAAIFDKIIEIELNDVPDIFLDERAIIQLILNLVRNALEAVPIGGCVTLVTYFYDTNVILTVKDNGPGISDEILDKIGTPFFTTKVSGTGLGLAICQSIAVRHGASIQIETGSDGTAFLVKFPVDKRR